MATPARPAIAAVARILLVDDHPIVREHLAALINHHRGLHVCGEAEDADSALEAVVALKPHLAIIDLGLKGRSGLELIKELRVQQPKLPMLVLSMHEEQLYAERAIKAGARGYLTKREATEKIIPAIQLVLSGKVYLSDSMSARTINQLMTGKNRAAAVSLLKTLTDRELAVFNLIGEGHSTRDVAKQLGVEMRTVETFRARIREKLQLDSGTALVHFAIRSRGVEN